MQKKERLGFNIILLGQIASGKDTQGKLLMEKYALKAVESGNYWRKLVKAKTPEGDWVRRTMGKGKPAPVALMKKFLVSELSKKPKGKDLIFFGNPRLKPEAQLLKKLLKERKEDFFVFYITLPDQEVYVRSLGRNRGFEDDRAKIATRLKWHKDQVGKTVAYFDSLGKLKKINGKQSVEKVTQDIARTIDAWKKKLTK
jgi:adenylate kinase